MAFQEHAEFDFLDRYSMTPRQFLDSVCHPNVSAACGMHDDIRLAVNAILSLDAAVGILHAKLKTEGIAVVADDREFRKEVAKTNPKYELLRDTAFSLKHGTLEGKIARLVSHHHQVAQAGVPFGSFTFGQDTFGGTTVFIEKNDGTCERASDVAMIVLRELDQLLSSHGQ